jgi:hypothetical protein
LPRLLRVEPRTTQVGFNLGKCAQGRALHYSASEGVGVAHSFQVDVRGRSYWGAWKIVSDRPRPSQEPAKKRRH